MIDAVNGRKSSCDRWRDLDEYIERVRDPEHPQGALIPVLHYVQELFGYLPEAAMNHVAQKLDIPTSEVFGVATFYSYFSLVPKGKYNIVVCLGTACYVKGAARILKTLEEELAIGPKQTTSDGLFSLQDARCIGACSLAPVMMVNDDVYAQLEPKDIPEILAKYRALKGS
ncbi:MAG: NADH-quinone oxidoreductase subunit NuoE [Armatimonadota bacterium]